ncbi:hypothetical protein O181_115127 [Austropuccinia psidii MF-1]|uniref:Uncharacterized protein n=1 Tax=Austropuccinia psidii MF-1 TaxID=1389203 RepID=A0A9Q3K6W7_9BASI|nr:hypothetical protein [Austropuccinia psidii MF-1]
MPTAVQRQRRKSMQFRKSQMRNPSKDSKSDSMGDAIREQSDDDQDPREELLVENQEEIQLEAGVPQDTKNKNLCKHTQDAQKFLVTPTKIMAYIHGTATKITVCIENAQHPLIIDSGAHFSIVSRKYVTRANLVSIVGN